MSHCKLFQTIKREDRASSYKKPAQFCQYSSVDEAILFSGYVELIWFRSEDGWLFEPSAQETCFCLWALDKF